MYNQGNSHHIAACLDVSSSHNLSDNTTFSIPLTSSDVQVGIYECCIALVHITRPQMTLLPTSVMKITFYGHEKLTANKERWHHTSESLGFIDDSIRV